MTLEGFKIRIPSLVGISLSPTYEQMLSKLVGEKDSLDFPIKSNPELIQKATRQHDFFILHENGKYDKNSYEGEENFLGFYHYYDGERHKYIVAFPTTQRI